MFALGDTVEERDSHTRREDLNEGVEDRYLKTHELQKLNHKRTNKSIKNKKTKHLTDTHQRAHIKMLPILVMRKPHSTMTEIHSTSITKYWQGCRARGLSFMDGGNAKCCGCFGKRFGQLPVNLNLPQHLTVMFQGEGNAQLKIPHLVYGISTRDCQTQATTKMSFNGEMHNLCTYKLGILFSTKKKSAEFIGKFRGGNVMHITRGEMPI